MKPWIPDALRVAPPLDENLRPPRPVRRSALLINPFYPKDPYASFGKHVLTPSLALTSIAAATPASWEVRYWDENLLLGVPPYEPFPQVVGITVHLSFAQRAYALANWYRQRQVSQIHPVCQPFTATGLLSFKSGNSWPKKKNGVNPVSR